MKRFFLILILLATATFAIGQTSSNKKFIKISHSSTGTVGIDSSGQSWLYDPEKGKFVLSEGETGQVIEISYEQDAPDADSIEESDLLPPEERCTDVRHEDISSFLEDVVVETNERVEGTIFSGRNIIIKGLVIGDVVSFRAVTIESTGEVRGDVVAKEIIRESGGKIIGQRLEVPFPEFERLSFRAAPILPSLIVIYCTVFLIFIGVIIVALVPAPIQRIQTRIENETIKSFLWGLLVWFSLVPVFVLLLITIIGIPVALLIYPLIILAALALAFVGVSVSIGNRLCHQFNWGSSSSYTKAICGIVALQLLGLVSGALGIFALFTLYVIAIVIAITIGLGAVVSTRFGTRPKTTGSNQAAASPVPPVVPPLPPNAPPPPSVPPLPTDEKDTGKK